MSDKTRLKQQFTKMMQFRHACKVFDETKKIPHEDFNYILESARLSPSSFGFEPWKFLIIQDAKLREKIKQHTWGAQNSLPTASHFIITLARTEKSMHFNSDYIQYMMEKIHHIPEEGRLMRKKFYQQFQEHDFNLTQNDKTMQDWAKKQTYIALANMMNAAAFINIDTCPIEGFKEDNINQLLADEFDIDTAEFKVSHMLAFGYRINEPGEKTRLPLQEISRWY
ncbi:MAG: NAD(P)H-dependent oxidoreductase [gamma proteobacterium symbiont of Taylorina sp.]|nr:NAD(P)H-dependent oxidoreductase [gamma proteobacterium symbiont of Taylorina sp.]